MDIFTIPLRAHVTYLDSDHLNYFTSQTINHFSLPSISSHWIVILLCWRICCGNVHCIWADIIHLATTYLSFIRDESGLSNNGHTYIGIISSNVLVSPFCIISRQSDKRERISKWETQTIHHYIVSCPFIKKNELLLSVFHWPFCRLHTLHQNVSNFRHGSLQCNRFDDTNSKWINGEYVIIHLFRLMDLAFAIAKVDIEKCTRKVLWMLDTR